MARKIKVGIYSGKPRPEFQGVFQGRILRGIYRGLCEGAYIKGVYIAYI